MDEREYIAYLEAQVKFLEERIRDLRLGRRVLMNLLETQEREKRQSLQRLTGEKKKLLRQTRQYAREVLARNLRIRELEQSLASARTGLVTERSELNQG